MKTSKTAILSALAILLQAATACGTASGTADTTDGNTSVSEETTADLFAGLPVKDYGGREFNFLIRETELNDYYIEQEDGDVLDDAVYRRNMEVEQRYNISIQPITIDASWNARATYIGTIRSAVMAGGGEYDLIDGYAGVIGDCFTDKVFMNLWDVPNLRLNEKWWSGLVADELTINGKLYAMTGDLAVNMWRNFQAMYFNKQLAEDYQLPSLYDSVKNGTWTFDRMLSSIKNVSKDLDGNSKMDMSDRWGVLVYDTLAIDNLHNAFNLPVSKRNSDGLPVFDFNNEILVGAVEKIMAFTFENPDVMYVDQSTTNIAATTRAVFSAGNALFLLDTLAACTTLRDSDTNFGILPLPKYSEDQEAYYTSSRDGRSMFAIPIDVKDVEFVGLITEALAVASNRYVIPAYYDTTLKTKVTRDDESAEMLDIIRDGLKLEFAAEYSMQTNQGGYVIRVCVQQKTEYASKVASSLNLYEEGLKNFLVAYQ